MEVMKITAEDTVPIRCAYPADLTGGSVVLLIGSVSKTATITEVTDTATYFEFERTEGDLAVGSYESAMVITDANGEETTDIFTIIVNARPS